MAALVGEINDVGALIDAEIEIVIKLAHALVAHIIELDARRSAFSAVPVLDQFQEALVLGRAALHLEQLDAGFVFLALFQQLLGLVEQLADQACSGSSSGARPAASAREKYWLLGALNRRRR